MKSHGRILAAFLLNLLFSIFELIGGIFTGSVAIISDALHDFGDAASIGISCFLEKKSTKKPDDTYTYGYARYSLLGSIVMTLVLIAGSVLIIFKSFFRLIAPIPVNYDGMLILAVTGLVVNFIAAFVTHKGSSLNEKAVNLHMLEDVLGWAVVLIGAIAMKLTNLSIIDPLLSLGVAIFMLLSAVRTLWETVAIFLEKTPKGIRINDIRAEILKLEGIADVHHMHLWSIDGNANCATLHIVTDSPCTSTVKAALRKLLQSHGIIHATIETEAIGENCMHKSCAPSSPCAHTHCHHSHHH